MSCATSMQVAVSVSAVIILQLVYFLLLCRYIKGKP